MSMRLEKYNPVEDIDNTAPINNNLTMESTTVFSQHTYICIFI